MPWQVRKAGFQTKNQFSLFWRTGFQEKRAETRIPLGKLGLMENLKTPAHHQLHPCKPPHLQGCSECLDVKKTILAILENVQIDGFQDVQDLSFSNLDKVLNDVFSASSVVSSHGPSAAAKEHEKRILESILPPDLRQAAFL